MQSLCIITTQRRESTPRSLATVSALASAHNSASVVDATAPAGNPRFVIMRSVGKDGHVGLAERHSSECLSSAARVVTLILGPRLRFPDAWSARVTERNRKTSDRRGRRRSLAPLSLHAPFRPEREENVAKSETGPTKEGGGSGGKGSRAVAPQLLFPARSPDKWFRGATRVPERRRWQRPRPSNPGKGRHGTQLPHADVITGQGLPWCMFRAESRPGET
jgi:hypothetical protein